MFPRLTCKHVCEASSVTVFHNHGKLCLQCKIWPCTAISNTEALCECVCWCVSSWTGCSGLPAGPCVHLTEGGVVCGGLQKAARVHSDLAEEHSPSTLASLTAWRHREHTARRREEGMKKNPEIRAGDFRQKSNFFFLFWKHFSIFFYINKKNKKKINE